MSAIRALRLAGYLEGTTLIALLFVAVPIKYLLGVPAIVSLIGPVHGLAFCLYITLAAYVLSIGMWRSADIARILAAAFVPFGFLMAAPLLRRAAMVGQEGRR